MPKTLKRTKPYSSVMAKKNNGLSLIQINQEDKVNGFYTLLTNGSVKCLPDEKYIVPKYCLDILTKKRIKFAHLKP